MCDKPSDSPLDEPEASLRAQHCTLRENIRRFQDAKVTDFETYRRQRERERLAEAQISNDLAMAYRSMELAPRDDKEPA